MKATTLTLTSLLLVALCTEAHCFFYDRKPKCCYGSNFVKRPVPSFLIRGYRNTSSTCSHQAVLVELRKGKEICVDPSEKWFQNYEQMKKKQSSSGA
ncbi:chemokine (C-C motif) ligand 1 [Alligator mississippiensis]|uniref:Chemokine (C-C motif) ligand 1 n=1 Tax=Alligator mississippiensis TaxID=8496 RepID=A0A151N7F8_ALLMI|nr:chemokine (C-C motif) ligand 1 [Alligator mississippiensis]